MRAATLRMLITAWLLAACSGGDSRATESPTSSTSDGASADEASVSCGATISADLVLAADLNCPNGIALILDTPEVTLDLGGHTLNGPGPGRRRWPLPDFDLAGVSVRADNVTVTNGTLRGFGIGVVVESSSGVTVRDVLRYLPLRR
jgi:hypothetical protein